MADRVEDLLRELAPQVLGVLARRFGDFCDAEDATQEALLAAATHWDAVPDNPRGWLIQTGSRKLLDQRRADRARRRRETLPMEPPPVVYDEDDTLMVLFLCCHPGLGEASAIALTLRAVGGLTTGEIARAFLVPEATMGQRISRAKQRIRTLEAPFRMPERPEWADRLRSVLHVLYLIFNEGYAGSSGPLVRVDLSGEAIRLARMLHALLPGDGEVAGLLALMLLTDARRPARVDDDGDLVPLAEQDRGRWLRPLIREGTAVLDAAFSAGAVGPYQLQAAIAALHDRAAGVQDTDWPQILALYGLLERMTGSPVVALNRAVAAAMVHGPAEGLRLLDALDDRLGAGHRHDAVRGHLCELAGDAQAAVVHYRAAAARTASTPERRYLTMRAARLNGGIVVPPS
ncbi:RNA polymerase sigma factor [Dactylosporangium sp. NBC_01737]|uniref:RNA polymerase sigma factor n=1 Tax=Dactylosporangium sp. NBC_01737 TaxID=2975959 RepID=UPI002E10AA29|nr:RNA polymerase sigma factor [Dactylosporangium sp. NBC_01737]